MKFILTIQLCIACLAGKSQDFSQYRYGVYNGKDATLFCRILYPVSFDSTKKYPVIVFLHGAFERGNDMVPVRFSRDYNNRLQKLGSDVKFTEYPGVYHDCWNNVFAEPELMSRLFSKSKK